MSDSSPPRWTVAAWESIPGLRHGFFGRRGGISEGSFSSLNISLRVGDEPAAVAANRALAARSLGVESIALARQVHGARVALASDAAHAEIEADALLVREPGLGAGVLTADCVPLLLVAPQERAAVAVHAGWKGTAAGIAARAVEALCASTGAAPATFTAALGPAIDACCYEVGEEVATAIEASLGGAALSHARRLGQKRWIDLRTINAELLASHGLEPGRVHRVGGCTRCSSAESFSHRGSGGVTGRQLSAVGWV